MTTGSAYYLDANNAKYETANSAMLMDVSNMKGTISNSLIGNAATYADTENVTADKATVGKCTTLS